MGGILWLASYPKSGNTWLRVFLANYFRNPETPFDINNLLRFGFNEASREFFDCGVHVGRRGGGVTDPQPVLVGFAARSARGYGDTVFHAICHQAADSAFV